MLCPRPSGRAIAAYCSVAVHRRTTTLTSRHYEFFPPSPEVPMARLARAGVLMCYFPLVACATAPRPPIGYYQEEIPPPPGYDPVPLGSSSPYGADYSGQYWYRRGHDHDHDSRSGQFRHEPGGGYPSYPPSGSSHPAPAPGGSGFGHAATVPPAPSHSSPPVSTSSPSSSGSSSSSHPSEAPAAGHSAPSPSSTSSGSHCSDPKKQPPC